MRAVRFTQWGHEPALVEVPVPEPGPGQVLLKIAGAGVCHSDLHLMEQTSGAVDLRLPFTMGHEAAGWVQSWGDGVTGLTVGDPVVVYGPWGCGHCHACAAGRENYCERAEVVVGGLGRDGAMADYMLVPHSRWLVPLGGLDPVLAAPLTDAGLTPYHALARSLPKLRPGTHAVLIGVGGLGHLAVQLVRALSSANVIAVDVDEGKLALATEAGAHHTVHADEAAARRVRDLTEGRGAALVMDLVGAQSTMELAAATVAVAGDISVVGMAGGALRVGLGALPWEASVSIPYWGSRTELIEVIELARRGVIAAHVERFPLDEALDVFHRLRKGAVRGRAVLVP